MSRLCQTQPNPVEVSFHWVILYDWDVDNPTPFGIELKDQFSDSIPESWYLKKWKPQHRKQKVNLRVFPGRTMSVFCKIEKGNRLIFNLNY